MLVEGTDLPLWGLEINPEKEKEKFRAYTAGGRLLDEARGGCQQVTLVVVPPLVAIRLA